MSDVVDFRVDERHAIGHDPLNTIVFRKVGDATVKSKSPRFYGAVWRAVAFVYMDKRVLLRVLREMGCQAAETCVALRSMADDLREARKVQTLFSEPSKGREGASLDEGAPITAPSPPSPPGFERGRVPAGHPEAHRRRPAGGLIDALTTA